MPATSRNRSFLHCLSVLLMVFGPERVARAAEGAAAQSQSKAAPEAVGPLPMRVEAFLTQQRLRITVTPPRETFPAAATEVELAVSASGRTVLQQRTAPDPKTGQCRFDLEGNRLPPGKFAIETTATNRQSGRRCTARRELDRPLRPEWLGTTVGISDRVPSPWTPVEAQGPAVKVWGREYRFEQSILPTKVTIQGTPVLARPISLSGSVNGKPIAWKPEPIACTARKETAATLAWRSSTDGLSLEGTATIEYDGMVRVDLAMRPAGEKSQIDRLVLEVPLQPVHARYLYHFPGQWGSVANSGFLPEKGWTHAFKPFVWLGDEDRGFSWFCESDENWRSADPNRAVTIDREPQATVLRCHLVERPLVFSGPLRYTFGFQATPVKAPEKTVWDYRITHHGNYGLEREPAGGTGGGGSVVYRGAGHFRAEAGTFECWYRPAFDTERGVAPEKRKHQNNREIFTLRWGDDIGRGSNCGIYWNHVEQGLVAWSRKEGNVTLYLPARFDWKAGSWHHLALTWGEKVRIYIDGKLTAEAANSAFIPKRPDQAKIEIGSWQAAATIDEVRILDEARPPVAAAQPFTPDAHTLLLDHFDEYGVKDGRPIGTVDSSVRFVPARFGKGPTWEPSLAPSRLDWLASMGVRTVCFHEHWSPYQSHPYVTQENRPRLRSLVEACHQRKLNLLLYMSRQFADNAPEWEMHSKESLQEPNFGAYVRQPQQKAYVVCWRSPWKDFCLFHLDRLLAEFGHDGWYLDGPEWPMACANREHGCGYTAADGKVRPTYDIFATRDFMKRLYVLTRQRRPEGQLNIHNSTVMVIPTLGFGTSSWGGEQLDAIKPPVKTLDVLPMDAFRTEFMGRQWGVPSEFLVYDGRPYYAKDLLAYTLLHGVLIRPTTNEDLTRIAKLWKVYDSFPFRDAKVHPYWANRGLLDCSPPVYATAYERPGEGLLVFITNLADQPTKATLGINGTALGWKGAAKAWDAISGETVPLDAGRLTIPLDRWEYRVLRIRP